MSKKDLLLSLINSLTVNEKRYFSMFSQLTPGEKNYEKLFKALDGEEEYDTKKIKGKLGKTNMNLSYEKGYLQKMLLKSLRNYNDDGSIVISLSSSLMEIEILFNKQQYDLCLDIIQNQKKIAIENEVFGFALQLIAWEKRCQQRKGAFEFMLEYTDKGFKDELELFEKYQNLSNYKALQLKMFAIINKEGNVYREAKEKALREIMQHPLMEGEHKALSHQTKQLYYEILIFFHHHTYEIQKAYELCKLHVALVESKPEKIKYNPQSYFASLLHLGNRCTALKKYDEALECINKIEQIPNIKNVYATPALKQEVFRFVLEKRMEIFTFKRDFKKSIELYEKNIGEITKNKHNFFGVFFIVYYYYAALSYFFCGKYNEALALLRIIINQYSGALRLDFILFAHILHLMTHYELKHFDLLPYLVKSFNRLTKTRKVNQQSIPHISKMFLELSKNSNNEQAQKAILEKYRPIFEEMLSSGPESMIVDTVELPYWLGLKTNTIKA
jgi:tetratricopeptide (TPR) repeat protein